MTAYSGLCIGGPNDGKLIAWQAPRMKVTYMPPSCINCEMNGAPPPMPIETTYQWQNHFGNGVWLHESMTEGEMMMRLLARYQEYALGRFPRPPAHYKGPYEAPREDSHAG